MPKEILIFDTGFDSVISSHVASGKTDYGVALDKLFPLINRFDAQRKLQNKKFYKRLQRDLINGCIMPPITIAFVDKAAKNLSNKDIFEQYVNENINDAYILDGMQRLNTLKSASDEHGFDYDRSIYVNIIVANTQDKLLYRMITLNNGQRPMTPRHQIEILTAEMFDFTSLKNISVQTEKEHSSKIVKGVFNVGDVSKGYLGFLTDNVNNENNKIVDEKMDEILVSRVLDSTALNSGISFDDILNIIDRLCENDLNKTWFKVNNNLIGFCVGIKRSHHYFNKISSTDFSEATKLFESGFKAINQSKVNLGKYRRELSKEFIEKYENLSILDESEIIEHFATITSQ